MGHQNSLYGELTEHAPLDISTSKTICHWQLSQTQSMEPGRRPYRHTADAIRQIYRTEGLGAFYKGLVPSLFGIAHVAVQFPLYEKFKNLYGECFCRVGFSALLGMSNALDRNEPLILGRFVTGKDPEELGSSEILLCSAGSKAIASVTTYPHEVVRTRLQIQRSGEGSKGGPSARRTLTEIIKDIAAERGFKGFYRGLTVNLFRTVPASALTILT
jgi:solute carrier family 25 folate transporter 32